MEDCLFCKIVSGDIESDFVYEDDFFVVFKDINPKAVFHFLIVPKKHIGSLLDYDEKDREIYARVFYVVDFLTKKFSVEAFNLKVNNGKAAGQEIDHLHFHYLAN